MRHSSRQGDDAMKKTFTRTLDNKSDMQRYLDQVWLLLVDSYEKVTGGLHYSSPQSLLEDTQRWRLVIHYGRVIAVTIYKAKRGWKLVAMAKCKANGERARRALKRLIQADLPRCWMELSERAEDFVIGYCGGHKFVVHASLATNLLDKSVSPALADGFHYKRIVAGVLKAKVIVGTPQIF